MNNKMFHLLYDLIHFTNKLRDLFGSELIVCKVETNGIR